MFKQQTNCPSSTDIEVVWTPPPPFSPVQGVQLSSLNFLLVIISVHISDMWVILIRFFQPASEPDTSLMNKYMIAWEQASGYYQRIPALMKRLCTWSGLGTSMRGTLFMRDYPHPHLLNNIGTKIAALKWRTFFTPQRHFLYLSCTWEP